MSNQEDSMTNTSGWPDKAIEAAAEGIVVATLSDPSCTDSRGTAGFYARAALAAVSPFVEQRVRAAKGEALREFSRELHDRAAHLNGARKNEAWFCSDRAFNRAAEVEGGAREGDAS